MSFKATSFLGLFSIRNGCIIACIIQVVIGVFLWSCLKYLRPMLQVFNILIMVYFILGAVFGLYGIWKRSELITWLYIIHLGSCATIVLLLCIDFAGIMHVLPRPPVAPSVPIKPPVVRQLEKLEENIANKVQKLMPAKTDESKTKAEEPLLEKAAVFLQEKLSRPAYSSSKASPRKMNIFNDLTIPQKELTSHRSPLSIFSFIDADNVRALKIDPKKAVPSQTEGQSEEVSRDEIPPEVKGLPVDLQKQVSATTKVVKHVIKFACTGILAGFFVFQIYCSYIVFTFVLNKCTSRDEYTNQPEQFQPLLQGESVSSFADSAKDETVAVL